MNLAELAAVAKVKGDVEQADNLLRQGGIDHSGTQGQNVGVVVFTGVCGCGNIVALRSTHFFHLVCDHSGTDSRAIDYDAELRFSTGHFFCRSFCKHRIIDWILAGSSAPSSDRKDFNSSFSTNPPWSAPTATVGLPCAVIKNSFKSSY